MVKEISSRFETILVDSPPGMNRNAIAALRIAKELIIVTTPDIASLSNALKLKTVAERPNVKPWGLIISRATREELDLSQEEISSTLELPALAVIPEKPFEAHWPLGSALCLAAHDHRLPWGSKNLHSSSLARKLEYLLHGLGNSSAVR